MEIHERLKKTRKEANLTQQQVAQTIGVSSKQVWRWETEEDDSEMGILKLKALCILYNVSADYILGLSNKKSRG